MRLHHVMIAIPSDGERAARGFYLDLLGLQEIEKPAVLASRGGFWLHTDSLPIHIGLEEDFRPSSKAHLALECDDLESMQSRLISAGHQTSPLGTELPGFRRIYTFDPFGNRIELVQAERPT